MHTISHTTHNHETNTTRIRVIHSVDTHHTSRRPPILPIELLPALIPTYDDRAAPLMCLPISSTDTFGHTSLVSSARSLKRSKVSQARAVPLTATRDSRIGPSAQCVCVCAACVNICVSEVAYVIWVCMQMVMSGGYARTHIYGWWSIYTHMFMSAVQTILSRP